MNEALLSCPQCQREFELPHKSTRADDIDFLPLPRLLPCLHTACHSCLCEMRDRSELGKVICPVCRQDHIIKGASHLPLDVSVLKRVMDTGSADNMSFCSRCYDEVPAYSWCSHCSVSLCEFHHQDHKLSVDTSRHEVFTFKEVSHRNIKIRPKLPPIPCPEINTAEANAYCKKCEHLVSVHAALQNHADCNTIDCKTALDEMRRSIKQSEEKADKYGSDLKIAVKAVKNRLHELDSEVERCNVEIENEFDAIRRVLDEREREIKERVTNAADKKREKLTTQLKDLSQRLEETALAYEVSESAIRDTKDISNPEETTSELAAYLVGIAQPVSKHLDKVNEAMKSMPMTPLVDPVVSVSFNRSELVNIKQKIPVLGAVQTLEDNVEFGVEPDDYKNDQYSAPPFHSHKNMMMNKKTGGVQMEPLITFNIKTDPTAAQVFSNEKAAENVAKRGSVVSNIVVEARAARTTEDAKAMKEGRGTGEGKLLGQVILSTELDKRLVSRHEVRSFFESVVVRNIPIVKLSKEFIPKAYDSLGGYDGSPDGRRGGEETRDYRAMKAIDRSLSPGRNEDADTKYGNGPDPEAKRISMLHDHRSKPAVRHLHHYNHL